MTLDQKKKKKKKEKGSLKAQVMRLLIIICISISMIYFLIKILIFYSRLGYLMKSSPKIYKIIHELIIENVFNKLYEW